MNPLQNAQTSLLLSPLQCDYSLVQSSLTQLEALCKASWEQLKILDKAEEKRKGGKAEKRRGGGREDEVLAPEGSLRHRLPKILKECQERLKVLRAVHRRVINRCDTFGAKFSLMWSFKLNSESYIEHSSYRVVHSFLLSF